MALGRQEKSSALPPGDQAELDSLEQKLINGDCFIGCRHSVNCDISPLEPVSPLCPIYRRIREIKKPKTV